VETALHKSYDYRKSKHFGDHLFPYLMNSAINYAFSLSQQLNFTLTGQKEIYESILIKFYWWYVLKASIVSFRQTKPTPLICLRSINNKTRILNQLLKQFVSENDVKKVLEQHNIKMSYDEFPTTPLIAATVVQMLANEEYMAYHKTYLTSTHSNVHEENVHNDEHENDNRFHADLSQFHDVNNTYNNSTNSISNSENQTLYNENYTWNQPVNFNGYSQACRFDPVADNGQPIPMTQLANQWDEGLNKLNNYDNSFAQSYGPIRNNDKNHHSVIEIADHDDPIDNWNNYIDSKNNNDNDNINSAVGNVDVLSNIFNNDIFFCSDDTNNSNTTNCNGILDNLILNDMDHQSSFDECTLPPFANFTFNSEFANSLMNNGKSNFTNF